MKTKIQTLLMLLQERKELMGVTQPGNLFDKMVDDAEKELTTSMPVIDAAVEMRRDMNDVMCSVAMLCPQCKFIQAIDVYLASQKEK